MTPTAKTIQIFLPTGDPQGIRIAEIAGDFTEAERAKAEATKLLEQFENSAERELLAQDLATVNT